VFAAHYLNEIEESSPELVLSAIQNVVRAREVSAVAKEANVARENIYRAFTHEGNPTYATFRDVLKAVGVKCNFEPIEKTTSSPTLPYPQAGMNSISMGGQSLGGPSSGDAEEEALAGLRLAYTNPELLAGMGEQRKTVRSEYGQNEDFIRPAAT